MAPLPKRRHSSHRQAQRTRTLSVGLPTLTSCSNCHQPIKPHQVCPYCGFYKGKAVVIKKSSRKKPKVARL